MVERLTIAGTRKSHRHTFIQNKCTGCGITLSEWISYQDPDVLEKCWIEAMYLLGTDITKQGTK